MPDFGTFGSVKITCHPWLPYGSIIVSSDVWEHFRKVLSEEGQDAAFLRALGIGIGTDPPKPEEATS